MVSTLSCIFIIFACISGIAIPLSLALVAKKKFNASLRAYFTGCAIFLIFAIVLEGVAHRLFLFTELGKQIYSIKWQFALYSGLMAGIFEETGRLIAFKTLLKNDINDKKLPFVYAAGHAGFETFCVLFFGMAFNLVCIYAVNLNADSSINLVWSDTDIFGILLKTEPYVFLLSIVERLLTLFINLGLSIIVWYGVKNHNPFWFPLAVFLHAFTDAVVLIVKDNVHILWVELIILCLCATCILISYGVHQFEKESKPDDTTE